MNIGKIGFGVYKLVDEEKMKKALETATSTGYTLIDTATYYRNEKFIGDFLKTYTNKDKLVITTKIWPNDMGYDDTLRSFEQSYKLLGKIDILLLHWPHPDKFIQGYKALERLYNEKVVKKIGVSNFEIHHLEKLKSETSIKPFLNQIELHPRFSQKELRNYLKKEEILIQSWSPIGKSRYFDDKTLVSIAEKYNKSVAQVILNWHISHGIHPIPKSETPSRIIENFKAQDFTLSKEDIEMIDTLDINERIGIHPDKFPYGEK